MNSKKLLVFLTAFIIYINYENYIKIDTQKQHRQIATLKSNIHREEEILKSNYKPKDLLVDYDKIAIDGDKYTYSQAMGKVQNQITKASKDICSVKSIRWAQSPTTKEWYDKLRMDVFLKCSPKNLHLLTNRLKDKSIIYNIDSFKAYRGKGKDIKKELLGVKVQIVAYRTHK